MKIQTALLTAFASFVALSSAAKADTVNARCDFYPIGEDTASASMPCTFSQRQGYITIQTQGGAVYEFSPLGDVPGNFEDAAGNPVYRQAGLGDAGQIFQLNNESIYVYWDTAPFSSQPSAPPSSDRVGTLTGHEAGTQINVHSDATQYSEATAYGLVGDQVEILECVQDTDTADSTLNWCQVQFLGSGAIGWVRSDFIIFPSDGF